MIIIPLRGDGQMQPNNLCIMSSSSTVLPSSPHAMIYCLIGFRPAGNILSILLILSKNLFFFSAAGGSPRALRLVPNAFI